MARTKSKQRRMKMIRRQKWRARKERAKVLAAEKKAAKQAG